MSPLKLARLAVKPLFGEIARMLSSIGKFILGVLIVICSLSTAYALPSDVTNPQGALWNLLESGRTQEAFVLEEQLKKILISSPIRTISPLGGGVSNSWLVHFENNVVAVLKGDDPEVDRAPQREAAAYVVDRALGLNMVPVTVVRKINGREYSLQLYYPNEKTAVLMGAGIDLELKTSRHADMGLFDYIIYNLDRDRKIEHNLVSGKEGRLVGIDHSRTFFSAEEYDLDVKQADFENASFEFREKLNRVDLANFSTELQKFLSLEEAQNTKKRLAEVKLGLEGRELSSYPQIAERAKFSITFLYPEELKSRLSFRLSEIENILEVRKGQDPFELLSKFTSFGRLDNDANYVRISHDWSGYSSQEKILFMQLLTEAQARSNIRGTIPMALQSILKNHPDDLPLLEKALPTSLFKTDYSYFLGDVARLNNLSPANLKYLRKMLWSSLGPQFVRIFLINADLSKINPEVKKLWLERVVVGLENGELSTEDARLIMTQKRIGGLQLVLDVVTRPGRRDRALRFMKNKMDVALESAPLKDWSKDYVEKVKTNHFEIQAMLEDSLRPRIMRCEGLF